MIDNNHHTFYLDIAFFASVNDNFAPCHDPLDLILLLIFKDMILNSLHLYLSINIMTIMHQMYWLWKLTFNDTIWACLLVWTSDQFEYLTVRLNNKIKKNILKKGQEYKSYWEIVKFHIDCLNSWSVTYISFE